jgi:hypothetical protein
MPNAVQTRRRKATRPSRPRRTLPLLEEPPPRGTGQSRAQTLDRVAKTVDQVRDWWQSRTSPVQIGRVDLGHPGSPVALHVRRGKRLTTHTIRQIADGAGASVATVSLIFNGRRGGYAETLSRIAAFLDISLDDLNAYLQTRRPAHKRA